MATRTPWQRRSCQTACTRLTARPHAPGWLRDFSGVPACHPGTAAHGLPCGLRPVPAGCVLPEQVATHAAGTRVVAVEELLNLMQEPQVGGGVPGLGMEFEEVALKLPLLAALSRLMHKFRAIPWALQNRKVRAGPAWHPLCTGPHSHRTPMASSFKVFLHCHPAGGC